MPFCHHCGTEIEREDTRYCPVCGKKIDPISGLNNEIPIREGLVNHLKQSIILIRRHPILLFPELFAVIGTYAANQVLGRSAEYFNISDWIWKWLGLDSSTLIKIVDIPDIPPVFWLLPLVFLVWSILLAGISGLFTFLTLHMAWNGSKEENVKIRESAIYIRSRVGKLFLASIIANIFSLTIILLPAALFMYTVMVVDFTGIREGLSKGFKLYMDKVGTSLGLVILYFVLIIILGLVPYVGTFLRFIPSVVIEIASLDLYLNYKLIP